MSDTTTVTNETQLNAAIVAADSAAAGSGTITISLGANITLAGSGPPLEAFNLESGVTVDLLGNGYEINGGGVQRGLFVYSGSVTVADLTLANLNAQGGRGGSGYSIFEGGGGAGLGGGLFVANDTTNGAAPGSVTLINVSFSGDAANGGAGGLEKNQLNAVRGGGGGLGGNGGNGVYYGSVNSGSYRLGIGGGGGIGAQGGVLRSTSGGGYVDAPGQSGIVPRAAGGSHDGATGSKSGGGGGAGDGILAKGSGGGGIIDSSVFTANGGFGGGAGYKNGASGGYNGGNGGFGGGGGGSNGNGGWGGGGGAGGGHGGFGGGGDLHTNGSAGGGGLGAGGDIFVMQGASLVIESGSLGASTVTGGAGYGTMSTAGSAFGNGMFIQGNESVTLAPPAATTLTIAGVIADQTGSGGTGSNAGAGTLVIDGPGTVDLTANNTFAGGIDLMLGTVIFGEAGATTDTYTISGAQFSNGDSLAGNLTLSYSSADPATAIAALVSADLTVGGQSLIYNVAGQTNTITDSSIVNANPEWQSTLSGPNGTKLMLDWNTQNPASLATGSGTGSTYNTGQTTTFLTQANLAETTCYLRGTMILTARGEVRVEDLRAGDVVATRFGPFRPIKWIGVQSFAGRFLGTRNAPICFHAGSIADNVPARDLYVSPKHSMVIDDRLVEARLLVNGTTITQSATNQQVDYFHIDLGPHDCIVANGAWSETYAAQANRTQFHNYADFLATFPGHDDAYVDMCLPRARDGASALWPIRAKLLARLPEDCLTTSVDLHLIVNGRRIDPIQTGQETWIFHVPASACGVYLKSNACMPALVEPSNDTRLLGFCIRNITSQTNYSRISVNANDRGFPFGVYEAETNGIERWRWTNGNCRLPAILFREAEDEIRLTVSGRGLRRYLLGKASAIPGMRRTDELAA